MNIVILTNEYPPNVYGGAGVHVEYLTREIAAADDGEHHVQVLSFGEQDVSKDNVEVQGVTAPDIPNQDPRHEKFLDAMARNVIMAGSVQEADIVHGHTWYSHLACCLAKQLTGAKMVLSTHSLEPHRPWKVEQLGNAYHGSSWVERTAYENADGVVAVSAAMQDDVHDLYGVPKSRIRTIHNGIDIDQYQPRYNEEVLRKHDVDPDKPFVLFVGRITRQKGILHLVRSIHEMDDDVQVVLCAGAPDTDAIAEEMTALVDEARENSGNRIIWINEMLPKDEVITLYSHATLFICPSVYEPFGIINLEAMACHTPVVASAVGGIPEVVVDGETGLLVPFEAQEGADFDPKDPEAFASDLAHAVNTLLADPERCESMAEAARARIVEQFSWTAIAEQTLDFYRDLLNGTVK